MRTREAMSANHGANALSEKAYRSSLRAALERPSFSHSLSQKFSLTFFTSFYEDLLGSFLPFVAQYFIRYLFFLKAMWEQKRRSEIWKEEKYMLSFSSSPLYPWLATKWSTNLTFIFLLFLFFSDCCCYCYNSKWAYLILKLRHIDFTWWIHKHRWSHTVCICKLWVLYRRHYNDSIWRFI